MYENGLVYTPKKKMHSGKNYKFISGLVTVKVNSKNPNIYYKNNEPMTKNIKTLKHMATILKVNGGYLIRKHTSNEKTFLSKNLVIPNNKGGDIILNSNPFFYVNGYTFDNYMKISYEKKLFSKNFIIDIEKTKKELVENLREGFIDLIKDSQAVEVSDRFEKRFIEQYKQGKISEEELISLKEEHNKEDNKKMLLFKSSEVRVDAVDPIINNVLFKETASYSQKDNKTIIVTNKSTAFNKKTSIIFFESKDLNIDKLEEITYEILNNDEGIGDELTKFWE